MARTQRIALSGASDTYTVLGADHLPMTAVEEYLQFVRDDVASPHTVKSYAAGLAAWWTVLEDLRQQHAATQALLATRRDQYRQRRGRELGDDNVWVIERHRELRSLEAIVERLATTPARRRWRRRRNGTRLPLLQIQTRGAYQSALDTAQRPRPTDR